MKKLLPILGILLIFALAGFLAMPVHADSIALDASTDGGNNGGSATTLTFSHTTGSGASRILFVDAQAGDTINSVTYNGVSMTSVVSSGNFAIFCLVAPASGANNVVITANSSVNIIGKAVSYTGAAQTCTLDSTKVQINNGISNGSWQGITNTSVTDNSWMVIATTKTFTGQISAGGGTTQRQSSNVNFLGDSNGVIHPAGTNTMNTFATDGTQNWTDLGITFAPSTAPPPAHPVVTIKGHVVIKDRVTINRGNNWPVQSIDVMKYSKDVICSPPSTSTVDTQLGFIKASGANYVAVSGYYDNPSCASDIPLLNKWNTEARAVGLNVWWRMKDLSWEGDYSVTKATSTIVGGFHQTNMDNWITANPNLLQKGDILTPFAEVQNGGINGVSYCGGSGICQFANDTEFNTFIQTIYTDAQGRVPSGVTVGYWGYDGFIAAGLNNPDWQGQSFLSSTTITSTGPMSIDDYPSSYGSGGTGTADNFNAHLALFHSTLDGIAGKKIPITIGEYGTIGATSTADQLFQINLELPMAISDHGTVGFNYWNLGPVNDVTGEGLVTNAYTAKPGYTALQKYFKR